MLHGRGIVQQQITQLLADARADRSGALLVLGDPGIGKTSVLQWARGEAEAAGMNVLATRGYESEASLPYVALHDLLRPALGLLDRLTSHQADALDGALELGTPRDVDRFAVMAGTLALLSALTEQGPAALLVDDAHWVDPESWAAIAFVARRLGAEGIAIIASGRTAPVDAWGFDRFTLEPVELEAATAIVADRSPGGKPPDPDVAQSLWRKSGGNPLALVAAVGVMSGEQLRGREPLPPVLPADQGILGPLTRRIEALTEPARRALLLAASQADGDAAPVTAALGAAGLAALEEAEAAGLMMLGEGRIAFVHPLARSAAYFGAPSADRRAAHRALANALTDPARAAQRAWHLAASAIGPDEEIARELEETAGMAFARGGPASAARGFERAARLTPDPATRSRRLLEAGRAFEAAGAGGAALAVLNEALPDASDPVVWADIELIRGRLLEWQGESGRGRRTLIAAAERIARDDPERAALLLYHTISVFWLIGDRAGGHEMSDRIWQLSSADDGVRTDAAALAHLLRGILMVESGESGAGESLILKGLEWCEHSTDGDPAASPLAGIAAAYLITIERHAQARRLLELRVDTARRQGMLARLGLDLMYLAELEASSGRVGLARGAAAEAVELARATQRPIFLSWTLGFLAGVEAMTGDTSNARAHAEEALALVEAGRAITIRHWVGWALGTLALVERRPEDAILHLAPVQDHLEDSGARDPGVIPVLPPLIEALLTAGRTEEGERLLGVLEKRAAECGRRIPGAAAARLRTMLCAEGDVEEVAARGMRLAREADAELEAARIDLALGERLRRANRREEARRHLRAALAGFEQIGARPLADRAREELASSGERIQRRHDGETERLTPQETQIALLASAGVRNREIANQLFLSLKTIEFHLRNAYRKLGVRSRAELAGVLPGGGRGSTSPGVGPSHHPVRA